MNKQIKKELQKVQIAQLPEISDETTEIIIPKFKQIRFEENSYYLIRLDKSLLNLSDMSNLITNWNKGTVPPAEYLKVDVVKILGKMIQVNSLAYDNDNKTDLNARWSGWLPITNIEVIKRL